MTDDITAPRPRKKPSPTSGRLKKAKLGVEVSEELIGKALEVYEVEGHCFGTLGLSEHMGISHAEAIAAVGQLRLAGKIRNYFRETYIATVPHRQRSETPHHLRPAAKQGRKAA